MTSLRATTRSGVDTISESSAPIARMRSIRSVALPPCPTPWARQGPHRPVDRSRRIASALSRVSPPSAARQEATRTASPRPRRAFREVNERVAEVATLYIETETHRAVDFTCDVVVDGLG